MVDLSSGRWTWLIALVFLEIGFMGFYLFIHWDGLRLMLIFLFFFFGGEMGVVGGLRFPFRMGIIKLTD